MKLYCDDFTNVILEEKVDFIIVDIPYNIGKNAYASNPRWWKNGNFKEGKSEKADSMFFNTDINFNIDMCLEYCIKNLKKDSSVIIFCSFEQQMEILQKYKKYKFNKILPLVFIKNNSSEVLKANMRIVGACEYGVQLFNGKLGTFNNNKKMIKNYFNMNKITNKLHPNQKPIDLLEKFILLFTNKNEIVLDFCMGSGSTGVACINTKRNFIGIELDENYFNIAKNRINELLKKEGE